MEIVRVGVLVRDYVRVARVVTGAEIAVLVIVVEIARVDVRKDVPVVQETVKNVPVLVLSVVLGVVMIVKVNV